MKSKRDIARYIMVTLALAGLMSSILQAGSRANPLTRPFNIAAQSEQPEPKANGKIACVNDGGRDTQIVTMNPDGSDWVQLTSGQGDFDPAWSPDGTQIAFARTSGRCDLAEIFVMNADGTHQRRLTSSRVDRHPSWSPDGTRIAFVRGDGCTDWGVLHVMDADGKNVTAIGGEPHELFDQSAWTRDGSKLTVARDNAIYLIGLDGGIETVIRFEQSEVYYSEPAWSPDGSMIAFSRSADCDFFDCYASGIWTVNPDGSGAARLTDVYSSGLSWSPDGTEIVFSDGSDLFVMNPDGSGLTHIPAMIGARQSHPSWQPVPLISCVQAISGTGRAFDAGGGSDSVGVLAGSECNWKASSSAGWISVASGGGPGNGNVFYSVEPNTSTASRTGTLVISGRAFSISQAGRPVRISSALVLGKSLVLSGENFEPGAVILLNGEDQKTRNDEQNPKTVLVGKKTGKKIKPGDKLQVRNPNHSHSEEFEFN